jgi:hypothetical protein
MASRAAATAAAAVIAISIVFASVSISINVVIEFYVAIIANPHSHSVITKTGDTYVGFVPVDSVISKG